jgi:uncharacterized protein (DUF433 family)
MSLTLAAEAPPLTADEHGTVRVTGTRVMLELVVRAHQRGMTPERIAERFDTLTLADVYAVVGYYLRHRAEVDEYLRRREAEADELRRRIEATQRPFPTRAELLARRPPDGAA